MLTMNPALMLPRVGLRPRLHGLRARSYSVVVSSSRRQKVWDSVDEAVKDVKSGDVLLTGGRSPTTKCLRNTPPLCFI